MRAVGWPGFVVRANLVRQLLLRICHHSAYCLEAVLTAAVRLMPGARQHLSGADILHVGASTELLEKRSCTTMLSMSDAIGSAGSLLALRTSGTKAHCQSASDSLGRIHWTFGIRAPCECIRDSVSNVRRAVEALKIVRSAR